MDQHSQRIYPNALVIVSRIKHTDKMSEINEAFHQLYSALVGNLESMRYLEPAELARFSRRQYQHHGASPYALNLLEKALKEHDPSLELRGGNESELETITNGAEQGKENPTGRVAYVQGMIIIDKMEMVTPPRETETSVSPYEIIDMYRWRLGGVSPRDIQKKISRKYGKNRSLPVIKKWLRKGKLLSEENS